MGKGSLLQRLGLVRKPPVGLAEFRELVIAEVLRRKPDAELECLGEDELELLTRGTTNITRGYAYYRENPRELRLVVSQLGDLMLYDPPKAEADELIILVRPFTFQAGVEGDADRGLARSLPGGLIAVVAIDTPERYVFTTASELREQLGMSDEAIWDRALANVRLRLDMTPPAFRPGYLMALKTDAGLASSFIVDDTFWQHPILLSRGDLVVAPIERDELMIAPLNEQVMVDLLRKLVSERESSAFLTDRLLLRRNGAWEDFE